MPAEDAVEKANRGIYERYYQAQGDDRNDMLSNPGVLFQSLAFEKANIRALGKIPLDRGSARILDVGCGTGSSLISFIKLGFDPANLFGVDIEAERITMAKQRVPNVDFRAGDARELPFADESFDLVIESTMFVMIPDEAVAGAIASEMLRVTKPGGHLMLVDWRYGKPGNPDFSGLSNDRMRRLFDAGRQTEVVTVERGALIPPVGRFLSRVLPSFYFVVQGLVPPLAGQTTTLLRKTAARP